MAKKRKPTAALTPEQARRILEYRRSIDPIASFQRGFTQQACYTSTKDVRLLSGNSRAGKTIFGAVELSEAALRAVGAWS